MNINDIIKNVGFELKHTDKNVYDLQEIYFYKNYKMLVDYNIEEDGDEDKLYTLMYNTDNKDMTVMDVFSTRIDYTSYIFSKQKHTFAEDIMNEEFLHVLRKSKINKLNTNK